MSTGTLITLDLAVSVLAAVVWLAAATLGSRPRVALPLVGVAVLASLGRIATVVALAGSGWWFVQEKVVLTVPLLAAGSAAALVAVSRRQTGDPVAVLALFGAGYAAVAGVLVTVLGGYPAGWSISLLTLALVGAATVITARVLGLARLRAPAVAAFTAAVLAVGGWIVRPPAVDFGGGASSAASSSPAASPAGLVGIDTLRGPTTPAPGGTVRRFTLTARSATITLGSGVRVPAWTFNGQVPGPPLEVAQGDLVEVTLHNADIADGVTLHWHGYDVPAAEDGVPGLTQEAVLPGQEYVYRFRAGQLGSYWYHTHEVSDRGVKLGLYGILVVRPTGAANGGIDLTVPVHTLGGSLAFGTEDRMATRDVAAGTPVRLRLVNTDDTPRLLALVGTAFRVVAVDGTDLNGPGPVSGVGLRIPAGGRFDVVFAMPTAPVALRPAAGVAVGLTLHPADPVPGSAPADTAPAGTRADPALPSTGDPSGWPVLDLLAYGTPAPTPFGARSAFDRRFTLVLDRGLALRNGLPTLAYTVNGRAFPDIPTEHVRAGELVEFTIVNRSGDIHPWHLHGHRVLVLSRDGQASAGSPLWLDTFDVRPGEVWRVAFRADNPGLWMNHCHNLAHADQGMALHLAYDGVTSSFHGGHGG